jgi:hypothetical protein
MSMTDYNLIGHPQVVQVYLGSGVGGDRTLILEPPAGHIWIAKMLVASHSGALAIAMQWILRDNVRALTINGPYNAAVPLAPYEYPWPFATDTAGPLVLVPGGVRVHCTMYGTAAAEDLYIKAHVHVIKGVAVEL